jgi:hypothetical protein
MEPPQAEPERRWARWLRHPAAALGIGLLAFPLAKLLWIPNYVFNFLTTLVHEIGHSACAWLMGMPSIPAVSPLGGGVALWGEQKLWLCALWLAGLGYGAYVVRRRRALLGAALAAAGVYAPLALTRSGSELFAVAGGVLFEIGGAAACFYVVMAVELRRPYERPLYALWGWWMLLNRTAETVLMLTNKAYWESQRVIQSGLAAGLPEDLSRVQRGLGLAPELFLLLVLILCVLALPGAGAAAWLVRSTDPAARG